MEYVARSVSSPNRHITHASISALAVILCAVSPKHANFKAITAFVAERVIPQFSVGTRDTWRCIPGAPVAVLSRARALVMTLLPRSDADPCAGHHHDM